MPRTIPLASYLFKRLRQYGVNHLFGVPGDFTLKALDHAKTSGVKWVGNCNELNAGFAADGYARTKGLGALFTTYGVGELSAINAVAGSYAEHVPVIHIAGLPQRQHMIQKQHTRAGDIVHHSLGDRKNTVFRDMYKNVTVAQAFLTNKDTAPEQIDNAIRYALTQCRPSYIGLPCDMVNREVNAEGLDLDITRNLQDTGSSQEQSDITGEGLVEIISQYLEEAQRPLLLVDRSMGMDQLRQELNDFVVSSGTPTLTMPSGASMIDHHIPNYYGVHAGPVGQIDTMPLVDDADLVLAFGPMFADTQTLGWTVVPDPTKTIIIGKQKTWLFGEREPGQVDARELLRALTSNAKNKKSLSSTHKHPPISDFRTVTAPAYQNQKDSIDQSGLYLRLNQYLRPHDIILLGNATPILGGRDFVLPDSSCRVIVSGLWFSIGSTLPTALGAGMAQQANHNDTNAQSPKGRVVVLEGDGSFQVTAQELSTIIHHRLNMTIFLINNDGYAYERLIHNPDADYHDVAPWIYSLLPRAFGAREAIRKACSLGQDYSVDVITLRTWTDLEDFLKDERFDNGSGGVGKPGLKLVEIKLEKTDVPEKFKKVFESAGQRLG
ncbi:hypothetical protein LTR05_002673 [Lithohypha guttulata]|uniref:Pyruvate decarboxylase n=1 Tax=Lithohypha guttulata TaxID=1690604 RepID=A0AAN7YCG4_9EURO|nr:hypothetical protein LTR05_002673 [Lithohypha guttulata]